MSRYKVVISGIHTADLKVLSNEEMKELFKKYQSGDERGFDTGEFKVGVVHRSAFFKSLREYG